MVIAIIAAVMMLFGEGSLENYLLNIEKPVKATVESKRVANEVLDVSTELGQQLKAHNKKLVTLRESFRDLYVDYDSKAADIEAVIDNVMTAREEGQKNILDARFAMKKLMTKEEWTEVFSLKEE